jgi:hypothetical protein
MRTTVARLVTLALLLAACSPSEATEATSTTSTSTSTSTTSTTSTTTTLAPQKTSLINGLPVDDPTLMNRRVLAVKIDNHPLARPQSGIDQADLVMEMLVEGITRFITIWHESDSDYLGPNRSGRPTDANLLPAFNEPTFTISGAQGWVQNMITGNGVNLIKELSTGTFRITGRRAPHNLYVDTFVLRETADAREYPDLPPEEPIWAFGPLPGTATPASSVTMGFGTNTVVWDWDETEGLWLRTADGRESMVRDQEGTETRIGVPVMVALYTNQYSVNGLPSSEVTGSGEAYVFADGKYIAGTWEREEVTDWFTLTDADGEVIDVPAGKIWVSLVPANRGLEISAEATE